MKILHVSPTYFSDESFIGGGERYVCELAKATAQKEEVVLLSFADRASSHNDAGLRIEYLRRMNLFRPHVVSANPLSRRFLAWLRWADVIHCYQVHLLSSDLSIILGKWLRKKVFVSDLGGGDRYALSYHLPILKRADAFLLLSDYSRRLWEKTSLQSRPQRLQVIYGGVDTERFSPGNGSKSRTALFVGRLLPHKGVDYLIDAIQNGLSLDVVGRAYHQTYFNLLKAKSSGKAVRFYTAMDDQGLVEKYRESLVTVLPSVYETCYGQRTPIPELLGLAALESMACGTPVIATDVASLPEIVEDGVTGFLVPPNDPPAIREKIEYFYGNPVAASEMGRRGREMVVRRFTWASVVDRCLRAYGAAA